MSEQSVPFYSVIMVRGEPISIPTSLPEGYSYRFFTPGMEEDWCRIQCSVQAFPDQQTAAGAFQEEFAGRPSLLGRRMIFVCDSAGRPVGTAALWPGDDLGKPMERVHWVALIPGLQGRGIGKALLSRVLEISPEESGDKGVYLTTQTTSFRAINIYRQFGFEAYLGPQPSRFKTQGGSYEKETIAAWRIIDSLLTAYTGCCRSAGSVLFGPPAPLALLFERENMFSKCSICKVFELAAPAQSGDVPHRHDYTQIWYVTRGYCEHYVEGQIYTMSVGDAFLLPPQVTHSTILQHDSSIICCEFYMESLFPDKPTSYSKLQEMTQNISFTLLFQQKLHSTQPRFSFSPQGQRETEKLLRSMLAEYRQEEPFYEDKLYLLVLELLLNFAREYAMSPIREVSEKAYDKYRSMVSAAIVYIDQHYAEAISLEDICRISMVSKTYFCYLFKMLTHKTFIEYLTDLRLERAMELLRQTNQSIIDISQAVGFRDSAHFSRTFKQARGVSPRDYRRAAKNQA